jgi:hypothetical protein
LIELLGAYGEGWGGPEVQLTVFWATLRRRWYFVLIALICTAAASYVTVDKVGPTYEAKGAVLLFPPVATVQEDRKTETLGNPYLMLGGLSNARDIVIRSLTAKSTHEELCRQRADSTYEAMREGLCTPHPTVTYEAVQDFTNNAPIILVTTEAKSPANAVTAMHVVMERVPKVLSDLQAGLNLERKAQITSVPLVDDRQPDVIHKDQIRAGIVAGAGTLALGLLMIGLLDGLIVGRRSGRTTSRATEQFADGVDQNPQVVSADPDQDVQVVSAEAHNEGGPLDVVRR